MVTVMATGSGKGCLRDPQPLNLPVHSNTPTFENSPLYRRLQQIKLAFYFFNTICIFVSSSKSGIAQKHMPLNTLIFFLD